MYILLNIYKKNDFFLFLNKVNDVGLTVCKTNNQIVLQSFNTKIINSVTFEFKS